MAGLDLMLIPPHPTPLPACQQSVRRHWCGTIMSKLGAVLQVFRACLHSSNILQKDWLVLFAFAPSLGRSQLWRLLCVASSVTDFAASPGQRLQKISVLKLLMHINVIFVGGTAAAAKAVFSCCPLAQTLNNNRTNLDTT